MSQSNNEVFGHESIINNGRALEWWENTDAFAPSSLPRSTKLQERHDVEPAIKAKTQSDIQAEEDFFTGKKTTPPPQKIIISEQSKKRTAEKKTKAIYNTDNWYFRRGHMLSYIGLFLFTVTVYFRPYEMISALSSFTSMALIFALLTLAFFIPTQLGLEGTITSRPTEVNMVLIMLFCALYTIPIAKSPPLAWEWFNESFFKAVLMFIVMINVIRTENRLKGMMWLSIGVGVWLSINAIEDYQAGNFTVEGYRVEGGIGGLFGNPNDMALHLVTVIPLTVVLFLSSSHIIKRLIYGLCFISLIAGTMITFSRGGFIGMMAAMMALFWKLGKKKRVQVTIFGIFFLVLILALAPGNYAIRILSIFIPGLDPVGSSDHRSLLLQQSIIATLRNPWGIGMGNFTIISSRNLVSHNAYTQVSCELGVIALIAYVAFMVKPLKRLLQIERETFDVKESSKFYYLSVGIQASLIGYMVGSFFASVAYLWFVYYLVAYAVALRRIYALKQSEQNEVKDKANTKKAFADKLSEATV